ncbi:MAG: VanZ family protein [Oscillospiraceae bacterium]|jgi:glycopeptide antibiotics resistance protein|nr:VanZ family protein [Oscillospiraceae bacterium]
MKSSKKRLPDTLICIWSLMYLLFLLWAILWKCGTPFIGDGSLRSVNLIPFRANAEWELQINLILFIPSGYCLGAANPTCRFGRNVLTVFCLSFLLELIQYMLAVGRSDVTDLILNVCGGLIGILFFKAVQMFWKRKERTVSLILCGLVFAAVMYILLAILFLGYIPLGFMILRI